MCWLRRGPIYDCNRIGIVCRMYGWPVSDDNWGDGVHQLPRRHVPNHCWRVRLYRLRQLPRGKVSRGCGKCVRGMFCGSVSSRDWGNGLREPPRGDEQWGERLDGALCVHRMPSGDLRVSARCHRLRHLSRGHKPAEHWGFRVHELVSHSCEKNNE